MSDILASVSVVLGAEMSGFKAAMADARKELKGLVQFSEGLKDIGTSLTTYVSAPLALLGAASVAASGKIESLKKGLEAITLQELGKQGVTGLTAIQEAAQQTGQRLAQLREIAKLPGLGFEGAVQGDVRLRAVGISAAQSAKSIAAFANAIATTGGGKNEFDRITVQLAQLSAKGKVLAQDLRPIIEAAPAVSGALQRLYGTVDSETISASLAKQGKSSTDFIAVLTDELAKLPQVTGGLKNAFENLADTTTLSLAKIGDGISKALNLPALVGGLSSGISRIAEAFANLAPGTQKLIVGLGVLAAATGPVLVAVGTLGAALPALEAGFATLGLTSAAAFGPIGLVAVGVAAAAALIIQNWDSLTAYFSSGEGAQLFSGLATAAQSAASAIGEAFSVLSANAGGNFGELISAASIFRTVFRELAVGITSALNVLAGTIMAISSLLTGDFSQAAEGAKQAFFGLIDPIANVLGFTKKTSTAAQELKEKFDALAIVTPGLAALLNNLGQATPFPVANLGSITKEVGLLAALKAQLADLQKQRDTETVVAAIKVDNAGIISLQKQIAALEGTDKASKKAADALAKLRQELARLTALDGLLGSTPTQMEVLERRAAAIENGLKSLVSAGVSPSSKAFQGLATEAATLNLALDKLKAGSGTLDLKPVSVKSLIPQTIGDTLPQDVARLLGDYAKQAKPFELPIAVKLNMQAILDAPKPFELLNGELVNLGKSFREISAAADIFGGSFDAASARIDVTRNALQNLISQGFTAAVPEVRKLSDDLKNQVAVYDINRAATDALTSGLASLGTGLLTGLGQLAAGSLTLEQFGGTVLGLVGKLATQLGEAIVAVGIGMLGLKTAFSNPFSAIAAGAALIVVGAALGAISSSIGSVGTGSASGGSSSPTVSNYGQTSNQTVVKVIAEFSIRNKDLVAIGRSDDYRSKRVG